MRIDYRNVLPAAIGVDPQRLHLAVAWREAPCHSEREHAALAWCEALTVLRGSEVPDDLYDEVRSHFDAEEVVALTLAVVAINGWNRFAVGLRSPVGSYQRPDGHK